MIVMRKIRNKDLYTVKNVLTGLIHSYGSSYENAIKQTRLLNMIDNKKKNIFIYIFK